MGKSYSVDLRLRVLFALDGGMSKMQAHKTFHISRSSLDDWLALREQTGSVQVLPKRPSKPGLHNHKAFEGFVKRHLHSTLGQMRTAWQEEQQQTLSLMCFSRALRVSGYTRKKRVISTANDETRSESTSNSKSLGSPWQIEYIWTKQA